MRGRRGVNPRLVDKHMRVVLPRDVVETLKLQQGNYVAFVMSSEEVKLRKVLMALG